MSDKIHPILAPNRQLIFSFLKILYVVLPTKQSQINITFPPI